MIWNLKQYGKNKALVSDNGYCLTYEELFDIGEEIGSIAESRKTVFCLCSNSIGSVSGYVSFINHGIVPVLLNENLDRALLSHLMDTYSPYYIWLPIERRDEYQSAESLYESNGYCLLKLQMDKDYPLYPNLALLLTTSGSTGSPKFVRQSYENIRSNTESIVEYLDLDSTERAITTLPMNYTYGLSIINTHLYVGATILLTDKSLMQREFWNFFKEQAATSFGGVPYTYEMLDRLRFFRMDLPSLRTMTQAGGKLIPELHEKFAVYASEKGKKFVVMYGQCEATARMGYLPFEKAVEKKGSMGIAIPGGKFRLIGADGKEITDTDTTGELVYEGKNVTLGYAEQGDDLIKGDERNGILITGDMAQFDSDGYFYIVGRKKRFLKIYGNRVNLDEVERLIKAEFDIEAACAGIDDHLFIFLTDDKYSDRVRTFAAGKTKLNPAAFSTVVIREIPKNDSGKTIYAEFTKYYT